VIEAARANGLLTVIAADNVVRLAPPLDVEDAHIDEALEILAAVCAQLGPQPAP
jgi:acetylornithine/N-succinyldiaminopimelate aminotransferase